MLFSRRSKDGPARQRKFPAGARPISAFPYSAGMRACSSVIYQQPMIESARRFPDVAPLTSRQIEALDLFDALANDPWRSTCHMEFHPGVYSAVPQPHALHRPHVIRGLAGARAQAAPLAALACATRCAPAAAGLFAERYGSRSLPGERGGVSVPGLRLNAPLEVLVGPPPRVPGKVNRQDAKARKGYLILPPWRRAVQIFIAHLRERDRGVRFQGARER